MAEKAYYLAVDVGGSAIKFALMDQGASFVDKGEIKTPLTGLDDYLDALTSGRTLRGSCPD